MGLSDEVKAKARAREEHEAQSRDAKKRGSQTLRTEYMRVSPFVRLVLDEVGCGYFGKTLGLFRSYRITEETRWEEGACVSWQLGHPTWTDACVRVELSVTYKHVRRDSNMQSILEPCGASFRVGWYAYGPTYEGGGWMDHAATTEDISAVGLREAIRKPLGLAAK